MHWFCTIPFFSLQTKNMHTSCLKITWPPQLKISSLLHWYQTLFRSTCGGCHDPLLVCLVWCPRKDSRLDFLFKRIIDTCCRKIENCNCGDIRTPARSKIGHGQNKECSLTDCHKKAIEGSPALTNQPSNYIYAGIRATKINIIPQCTDNDHRNDR